ncbi:MAG: DUF4168 domain-containing protein [Paracoccaceae bacterium]
MTLRSKLAAAASILALAAPLSPALAQSQDDSEMPSDQQMETDFSEEELESFVDAAMQVAALRQTYQARMQSAEDEGEREDLAEQATEEMRAAVDATDGIDVDTYNAIGQAAQGDEDLSEQINAIARDKIPEGESPDEG